MLSSQYSFDHKENVISRCLYASAADLLSSDSKNFKKYSVGMHSFGFHMHMNNLIIFYHKF